MLWEWLTSTIETMRRYFQQFLEWLYLMIVYSNTFSKGSVLNSQFFVPCFLETCSTSCQMSQADNCSFVGQVPKTLCGTCLDFIPLQESVASRYILPKTNIAPENRPSQKVSLVFQPSIFRCYVSFREGSRLVATLFLFFFGWCSYRIQAGSIGQKPLWYLMVCLKRNGGQIGAEKTRDSSKCIFLHAPSLKLTAEAHKNWGLEDYLPIP